MESKEADGADLASVTHGATQNGTPRTTQTSLHAFFCSTAIGTKDEKRKAARDCDAGLRAQGDKATDAEEAKAAREAAKVIARRKNLAAQRAVGVRTELQKAQALVEFATRRQAKRDREDEQTRAARAILQQSEEDYDDGPEFEIVEAPPQVSGHKKARRAGKGRWRIKCILSIFGGFHLT